MMKTDLINLYLDELFPNPKCELNYDNDWQLLIAIVLSAQTTDKGVNKVTKELFSQYSNLESLNKAQISDIESIIKPIGTYSRKALYVKEISNILLNDYNGIVPRDRDLLIKLPGVGRKTANVFLSEYYNDPYIAVDTHVDRVSKRLGLCNNNDNVINIEKKLMKRFDKNKWSKIHLQLVLFGRYKCKSIKPLCSDCKLKDLCKEKRKN